ncbi:MAG: hypothetical protein ACTS7I_01415 [Candidatus Hodgkinia cicadicola]
MTLIRFSFRWIWLRIAIEVHLSPFCGESDFINETTRRKWRSHNWKLNNTLKVSEW